MKTKTLLIAAAALAAGVISSQAQVYSQNIVGYANITTPTAGANYLLSVPFKVGVSNGLNEIFSVGNAGVTPTLPDGSAVLVWTGSGYNTFLSDSGSSSLWDDGGGNPLAASPKVPVGQGFFLSPAGSNVTNTFVGSVAISVGTTNSLSLPSAGANYLVGSVVPYAGFVTNGTPSGGGINLNGLPDGSALLVWTGAGYTTYLSDSGSPSLWDDGGGNPIPTPPSVTVGQGFFVSPAGSYTWQTGLSAQ